MMPRLFRENKILFFDCTLETFTTYKNPLEHFHFKNRILLMEKNLTDTPAYRNFRSGSF